MKLDLEPQDIEAIARRVADLIKSMLPKGTPSADVIMTTQDLATYLHVDVSWVYKRVSWGEIPYFKHGKYTRFKKSSIDAWLDSHTLKPKA
jgi:excisionase family DNA binding protein